MPNSYLSCGVAKHWLSDEITSNAPMELAISQINKAQSLEAIIESSAEALICAGCLLYPDLVEQLLRKVAKQQMTSQSKKSYFKENQAKTWSEILAHPLFADVDEDLYSFEWVSENDDCEYQ